MFLILIVLMLCGTVCQVSKDRSLLNKIQKIHITVPVVGAEIWSFLS